MTAPVLEALIFDALADSPILREWDDEQLHEAARLTAEAIEGAGTKDIVRTWIEPYDLGSGDYVDTLALGVPLGSYRYQYLLRLAQALREVSS
jgi:hypothetical protein